MAIWAHFIWVFVLILLAPARLMIALIPCDAAWSARRDLDDGFEVMRDWLIRASGS